MRSFVFCLCIMVVSGAAEAQSPFPRPYVSVDGLILPRGYSEFALGGGIGVQLNLARLDINAYASYDDRKKRHDGTDPNPNGHARDFLLTSYYRLPSGWMFGPGVSWTQLSTTNYTKEHWNPRFGIAKDFYSENCTAENCKGKFSMRVGAEYMAKGTDWQNGSQGPVFTLYLPSPSLRKHLFFREVISVSRFYTTVTEPANAVLTRQQMSDTQFHICAEASLIYRF